MKSQRDINLDTHRAEPTESCNDMVTNSVGWAEPTESCNDMVTNSVGWAE
jgi:hypothetical protein